MNKKIEIEYYKDINGKVPFLLWKDALKDHKAQAAIRMRLNRIRRGLWGDCKPVGKGVYEIRILYGPGYRIYFGQSGKKAMVLFGGKKDTQKMDIEKAQKYWVEFKGVK